MFPSLARLSKASRLPLTPKRGNKDYYKGKSTFGISCTIFAKGPMTSGTRQAYLPGGRRTGAPGKHVVRGKAKYRLVDEKVRFFVAPPIEEINNTPVRSNMNSPCCACLTHLGLAATICRPQCSAYQCPERRNFWKASERGDDC